MCIQLLPSHVASIKTVSMTTEVQPSNFALEMTVPTEIYVHAEWLDCIDMLNLLREVEVGIQVTLEEMRK